MLILISRLQTPADLDLQDFQKWINPYSTGHEPVQHKIVCPLLFNIIAFKVCGVQAFSAAKNHRINIVCFKAF